MDASILIVGSDDFCNSICHQITSIERLTIETVPTVAEALLIVKAQQPDVIILQAELDGSLGLCQTIKQQNHLAWIYTLVVGIASHTPCMCTIQQAHFMSEALESGADACVWLPLITSQSDENRLLRAQLQTGLRRVHGYREIARTNDLLSAIALSDPLTELNNRRALEWELPRQIRNARDRGIPISVLMLDVDFFKRINDTYGHLIGDRALQLKSAV
ncbi:MAG: diguanylate cyclase, partial [Cyanobacteria bacterium J06626_14]